MKPYYEDGQATIYHGDCEAVMPTLPTFDLVITSPPYNLGTGVGGGRKGKWDRREGGILLSGYGEHDDAMPTPEYETWQTRCIAAMWRTLRPTGAIFYNHKYRVQNCVAWSPINLIPADYPIRQVVVWARAGGINFAPTHYVPTHELIIVIAKEAFRLKSKGASGVGDVWKIPEDHTGQLTHPAPFPLGLPSRIIETTGPSSVLDPFMGSGTTLRAAKSAGIRSVGIDNCEAYCEMAAKRLAADGASQEVLAL